MLAFANPAFAVVGAIALVLLAFGLFKRLLKLAVFFAIVAAVAWVVFFAG